MEEIQIDQLIQKRLNELKFELSFMFKQELHRAIENLNGLRNGVFIDGIKCLRSSAVCALLDVSEKTLYRRRKEGKIGFIVKNGVYWYKVEDVVDYVNEDYVSVSEFEIEKNKRGPKGALAVS